MLTMIFEVTSFNVIFVGFYVIFVEFTVKFIYGNN